MKKKKRNIAFIDGQNLHLGAKHGGWAVNHRAFVVYLEDKYGVTDPYYWMGYFMEEYRQLYEKLQEAGFILMFKDHHMLSISEKKGNVDVDIVFEIMRMLLEEGDSFGKILLVSGDGDYRKMVDLLIRRGRFEKILFPNRLYASALYKGLSSQYCDFLDRRGVKEKIQRISKRKEDS